MKKIFSQFDKKYYQFLPEVLQNRLVRPGLLLHHLLEARQSVSPRGSTGTNSALLHGLGSIGESLPCLFVHLNVGGDLQLLQFRLQVGVTLGGGCGGSAQMFLFFFGLPGQRQLADTHPHVVEDVRHQPGVNTAGVGHVALASFVNIHLTDFALETLSGDAVEHGATVITKGKFHVIMNFKPVRNIDLEPRPGAFLPALALEPRTLRDDHLVAPLVDNTGADLALVTLLTKTPNEIPTVRTEGWLLQVDSHELVAIDLVDPTSESHSPLVSPAFFFLKGSAGLILFVLGRPLELNLDVKFSIGLQIQPDIVQRLVCLLYQVGERQLAVGDEVVGRDGGVVEHGEADLLGGPQQVRGESLVPVGVVGFPFCAGSLHVQLVHVYRDVGVEVHLLGGLFVHREPSHELGGLKVRGGTDRDLRERESVSVTTHQSHPSCLPSTCRGTF